MEILVPVSLGELYDKITILKIKLERIDDSEKKINIQKELDLLLETADKYPIESHYYFKLYNINNSLWSIEDNIRKKHKLQQFDKAFIKYAQMVYQENDKRSKIKREINIHYGSDIIEEKHYENYD